MRRKEKRDVPSRHQNPKANYDKSLASSGKVQSNRFTCPALVLDNNNELKLLDLHENRHVLREYFATTVCLKDVPEL